MSDSIKIFRGVLNFWPKVGARPIDSIRDTSTGMFFGREWAGRKGPSSSMIRYEE